MKKLFTSDKYQIVSTIAPIASIILWWALIHIWAFEKTVEVKTFSYYAPAWMLVIVAITILNWILMKICNPKFSLTPQGYYSPFRH